MDGMTNITALHETADLSDRTKRTLIRTVRADSAVIRATVQLDTFYRVQSSVRAEVFDGGQFHAVVTILGNDPILGAGTNGGISIPNSDAPAAVKRHLERIADILIERAVQILWD